MTSYCSEDAEHGGHSASCLHACTRIVGERSADYAMVAPPNRAG
jgi:hypothetical protein